MADLAALEASFGPDQVSQPGARMPDVAPIAAPTNLYPGRRDSLLRADKGKYRQCLDGQHTYASDSEACLAVVDAMVARHFTDGEIWLTLAGSQLFAARCERKGEGHTRELFGREIAKARQVVAPFPEDPGNGRRRVRVVASKISEVAEVTTPVVAGSPPAPLMIPAGDDFISRYVRYGARRTDAPLEAHELMAVLCLSALAGPNVRLPIATARNGWSLILWGMYIVNSTTGRKSTVINLAKDILENVLTPRAILQWEGSPQGMIQRLAEVDGSGAVFARDEYSGLMAQMNRGGHMSGMFQTFIKAFDGGVLENVRTKKPNKDGEKVDDVDRVEHPHLVKATAATWDSFMERCTIDNVLDGFLARFIFVTGKAEARPMPLLTAAMNAEFEDLVEHARAFRQKCENTGIVDIGEGVIELLWKIEQEWMREADDSSRPDAAGPALKRLSEAVLKVAALQAIDATPAGEVPELTVLNLTAALEAGERWKASTLKVVEALGATSFMRDTESVLQTITAHPGGVQVSELSRKHRRLRKRDFDEILDVLETRKQIEVVEVPTVRGRPPRVAYPYGHAPEQ